MKRAFTLLVLLWCLPLIAAQPDYAGIIASLIDPAKLATLGERQANPRIQKCVYWLEMARRAGHQPGTVIDDALRSLRIKKEPAALTKAALLTNLVVAAYYDCLDADGMKEMRKGNAPTIRRGLYKGDQLSVDHIIPRDICPELDNVIANLELMPMRMNSSKHNAVGARQVDLARKLSEAGLLKKKRLRAVESAAKKQSRR